MKAIWNNVIIAQSDQTLSLEGNVYFPSESLSMQYFAESEKTSDCPWKGKANYFDIIVDGQKNSGAAWVYRNPSDAARAIKNHVAFWRGVIIQE